MGRKLPTERDQYGFGNDNWFTYLSAPNYDLLDVVPIIPLYFKLKGAQELRGIFILDVQQELDTTKDSFVGKGQGGSGVAFYFREVSGTVEGYIYNVKGSMLNDEKMKKGFGDDLATVEKTVEETIKWIDENGSADEESKANEGEANIVCSYVSELIKAGVKPETIAVITPYNLQMELIKAKLHTKYDKVEVKSVDGFQGREKEVYLSKIINL